jgi:hypothetical protein
MIYYLLDNIFVFIGHKNARIGSVSGIRDYGSADSDPNPKKYLQIHNIVTNPAQTKVFFRTLGT